MTNPTVPWWETWNYQYANPDVYGPLVGAFTIQEAVNDTLKRWLPAYIAEFNRVLGGEILQVPLKYRYKPDYRSAAEGIDPSILVVCPGTTGKPVKNGNQTRAEWAVEASVCVGGNNDWQHTMALTTAYGTAMRACLAQQKSLGGIAETTTWVGESYKEKEITTQRVWGLMVVNFVVTTSNTMDPNGGPPLPEFAADWANPDPSVAPPAPEPIIETATVTIEQLGRNVEIVTPGILAPPGYDGGNAFNVAHSDLDGGDASSYFDATVDGGNA